MVSRKSFFILVFALAGLVCGGSTAFAAADSAISGKIVNGLRLLTLTPGGDNNFIIYRGDYIQPQLLGADQFEVRIPALDVAKSFPAADGERAYIKMKQTGTFAYDAGNVSGTIKVVEYTGPSYQALTVEEAARILQNTSPLILDVRTPGEYSQGRIQGSELLPVQVLQQNMKKLASYKKQDVLIYCATGNRSTVAARLLIENGFKKIYNLRYGIADWERKGYPVIR